MPPSADISAVSIFLSLKTLYDFKPHLKKIKMKVIVSAARKYFFQKFNREKELKLL